jgi:2-polyprenyl-3-methyl-5-hydroxy-6-metoxy-1,4-benzoquinol methylase
MAPRPVDLRHRAASGGRTVHVGSIEDPNLPAETFDVTYTLQTIEHVADPSGLMGAAFPLLIVQSVV